MKQDCDDLIVKMTGDVISLCGPILSVEVKMRAEVCTSDYHTSALL